MATDWRGMKLLDGETSEFLLGMMRQENNRIERQVLIIDPSAVMGLQIRRLFRSAGGETKAVFESAYAAKQWLDPALDDNERDALYRFVHTASAA